MNAKFKHPTPAPGVFPPNPPAPTPSKSIPTRKVTERKQPGPVSELLELVSSESFNSAAVQGQYLSRRQVINIIKVYLLAYQSLEKRNLPTRNAIFLPSHTGTETTYGTLGPNVGIRNWFSVQVAKATETTELELAFRRRGADISIGGRGNRTSPNAELNPSGVKNPAFRDNNEMVALTKMVELQLDLVYGAPFGTKTPSSEAIAPFKSLGRAIARNNISCYEFGRTIGEAYAGRGTPEGKKYPDKFLGCYRQVYGVIRCFFTDLPAGVSETTKTWARDTLAAMAKAQ